MTDWSDLTLYVGAHYRVVKREPHWIGVEIACEAGDVRIKLERVTAFEEPWVLVMVAVCSEGTSMRWPRFATTRSLQSARSSSRTNDVTCARPCLSTN